MTQQETISLITTIFSWVLVFAIALFFVYRQQKSSKSMIDNLQSFNNVRDELETVIADFVAGIVPWLAGIPPAYLSAYHAYHVLKLPIVVCIALGIVVEGVAFANVATYTEVSQFQREKQGVAKYEKGTLPKRNIILVIGFYLIVVFILNGMLGFFDEVPIDVLYTAVSTGNNEQLIVTVIPAIANAIAILLISSLTIPGAATISLRLQHRQFVRENDPRYKKAKKQEQQSPRKEEPKSSPIDNASNELKELYSELKKMIDESESINVTKLAGITNVTRQTVYNRIKELEKLGIIEFGNDNSIKVIK